MSTQATRYTQPAIWLHWITAVLMLFMLFLGGDYMRMPRGASLAGWEPSAHASIGILILLLGLARLLWRLGNPPPALPESMPLWQVRVSHAAHWTFYVLMIALPVTGLLALAPYGAERLNVEHVTFFKLFPVAFMPNLGNWTGEAHSLLFRVAKALVILHVVAALKHQFWDKDGLLARMLPKHSAAIMIAALLALAPAAEVWSQEKNRETRAGEYHWGLGAGFGLLEKPYVDIDSDNLALPILVFDNRWISLSGPRLDLKLPLDLPVSFALRARYSRDGYEASDSPALVGMTEREDSFWYGAAAVWRNDIAHVSVEWLTDASDNSGGERATLAVERGFEFGKFEITPRVSANWLSDDYVDYYFGVGATEALPLRAAYVGESAVNFEAGLRTTYSINPKQSIFLNLGVEVLDDVIQDSPIVDGSTQSAVFLGYVYMFK